MRRVAIIASASGNGKTTLGRALAERLGVRFVELDALVHGPSWTETPDDELRALLEPILAEDGWVIDGNYTSKIGTLVLDAADTIVWLDLPTHVWLWRLLRRTSRRVSGREQLWNGKTGSRSTALWGRRRCSGTRSRNSRGGAASTPCATPATRWSACAAGVRSSAGWRMVHCREWPRSRSASARSGPRRGRRDRSGVPRHAGAAVRVARPGARVLGDAEGRDAQSGPELQGARHRDGGRRGAQPGCDAPGVRERRQSRAGAGVQRHASRLGVTVVAARTANTHKLRQIAPFGADVQLEGEDIEDARLLARAIAEEEALTSSRTAWTSRPARRATIGLEFARDDPGLDVVLVAVGGGAMASGVAFAVRSLAEHVEVIGVQPVGAPAMALSWRQGTVVETDRIETIADGVAGRCPITEVLDDLLVLLDEWCSCARTRSKPVCERSMSTQGSSSSRPPRSGSPPS